ncbi:MAG TPA: hypothetical protein V6D34_03435 [Candidatus Sericytochromatia bacterium]
MPSVSLGAARGDRNNTPIIILSSQDSIIDRTVRGFYRASDVLAKPPASSRLKSSADRSASGMTIKIGSNINKF